MLRCKKSYYSKQDGGSIPYGIWSNVLCVRARLCVLMCERGSVLTPLRGGLVRDSMETLSEAVSVRERKRKVQREKDGKKGREKGTDGKKESSEGEERKRCVTSDDNALCLSPVILGGGADGEKE